MNTGMWAAIRWVKAKPTRGSGAYDLKVEDDDIPPFVAAARRALGMKYAVPLDSGLSLSPAESGSGGATHVVGVVSAAPVPNAPTVRRHVVTTEAGESRFRVREDGPWVADPAGRPSRGSSRLALEIAESAVRTEQARENFKGLIYAPSTSSSKDALFCLWSKLCLKRGVPALPVTRESILTNAAILREAGYKSSMAYIQEARHQREGHPWTAPLQAAFSDSKRACRRATGPTKRAEEVKFEWWAWLIGTYGRDPAPNEAGDGGPLDVMDMICIGQHFLLREVELSALFLDAWTIRMDAATQSVGLFLPVSKTDQQGTGVLRTLSCTCSTVADATCPFHAMARTVANQLRRFGFASLDEVPAAWLPLFGQRCNPALVVQKAMAVSEWIRMAHIIASCHPTTLDLDPAEVSGHTCAAAGPRRWAERGCHSKPYSG